MPRPGPLLGQPCPPEQVGAEVASKELVLWPRLVTARERGLPLELELPEECSSQCVLKAFLEYVYLGSCQVECSSPCTARFPVLPYNLV